MTKRWKSIEETIKSILKRKVPTFDVSWVDMCRIEITKKGFRLTLPAGKLFDIGSNSVEFTIINKNENILHEIFRREVGEFILYKNESDKQLIENRIGNSFVSETSTFGFDWDTLRTILTLTIDKDTDRFGYGLLSNSIDGLVEIRYDFVTTQKVNMQQLVNQTNNSRVKELRPILPMDYLEPYELDSSIDVEIEDEY